MSPTSPAHSGISGSHLVDPVSITLSLSLSQVEGRLPAIEQRYEELKALSSTRRDALEGALALYRMYSEADACQLWIGEKEQWLLTMEIPSKLEDLEVIQQR